MKFCVPSFVVCVAFVVSFLLFAAFGIWVDVLVLRLGFVEWVIGFGWCVVW